MLELSGFCHHSPFVFMCMLLCLTLAPACGRASEWRRREGWPTPVYCCCRKD